MASNIDMFKTKKGGRQASLPVIRPKSYQMFVTQHDANRERIRNRNFNSMGNETVYQGF